MLLDFEPVILESAGLDDDVTLKPLGVAGDKDAWKMSKSHISEDFPINPLVPPITPWKGIPKINHPVVEDEQDEDHVHEDEASISQGGTDNIESFSQLGELDFTFGLKDTLPGLKYLMTIEGPFKFVRGFFVGTRMTRDPDFDTCDRLIGDELVANILQVQNMTETIF
jgi:hypothetical protein